MSVCIGTGMIGLLLAILLLFAVKYRIIDMINLIIWMGGILITILTNSHMYTVLKPKAKG